MKDKFETFRASEKERIELKRMAKKAKMTKADYIRHCIFSKEITVIDGLDDFAKQLKAIGNNLNQLTTRANMGQLAVINLAETKEQLGGIYDLLTALCMQEPVEIIETEQQAQTDFISRRTHNLFANYTPNAEPSDEVKRMLDFLERRA